MAMAPSATPSPYPVGPLSVHVDQIAQVCITEYTGSAIWTGYLVHADAGRQLRTDDLNCITFPVAMSPHCYRQREYRQEIGRAWIVWTLDVQSGIDGFNGSEKGD